MAGRTYGWTDISSLLFLLLISQDLVTGHYTRRVLQCAFSSNCRQPAGSLRLAWGSFVSSVPKPQNAPRRTIGRSPGTRPSPGLLGGDIGLPSSSSITQPDTDAPPPPNEESENQSGHTPHHPLIEWITETTSSQPNCRTVPEEIQRYANLVTLSRAMEVTGLGEILRDPSAHVTLFAATDLAFETLAEKRGQTVEELLKEGKYLRDVLNLHVAQEALKTSDLSRSQSVDTRLTGYPLLVTLSRSSILVVPPKGDPASIQLRDIPACNSIIHIIDHVLTNAEDRNLGIFAG